MGYKHTCRSLKAVRGRAYIYIYQKCTFRCDHSISNESKEVNKDEEMDVLLGDHFFNIAAGGRQHSHAHTYTTHTHYRLKFYISVFKITLL